MASEPLLDEARWLPPSVVWFCSPTRWYVKHYSIVGEQEGIIKCSAYGLVLIVVIMESKAQLFFFFIVLPDAFSNLD